jgi:dihydrofolate reductase
MSVPTVGLIWAQSTSGIIGRAGGIPWDLPEDQARFKEITVGHTVVMGRLTWESLPSKVRPLPGRRNIVITRNADYQASGAETSGSIASVIADGCIWIIGGAEIYSLALPAANRCEVTEVAIDLHRQDADAVAPVLDETWVGSVGEWRVSRSGLRYRYLSYRRS